MGSKNIITIMIGILILSVMIAGGVFAIYTIKNGNKVEAETARAAVTANLEGFLTSLDTGDVEAAKTYCSESAAATLNLDGMNADTYRGILVNGLGLSEETMSEDTRAGLNSLIDTMKGSVYKSANYDLAQGKYKKGKDEDLFTMDISMTGCGNLNAIDFSGAVALANISLINYTTDNQVTLMDVCALSGTEVVRDMLKKAELASLFSGMNAKVLEQSDLTRNWTFTYAVEKDEDGNVTGAKLIGAEERLGGDGEQKSENP